MSPNQRAGNPRNGIAEKAARSFSFFSWRPVHTARREKRRAVSALGGRQHDATSHDGAQDMNMEGQKRALAGGRERGPEGLGLVGRQARRGAPASTSPALAGAGRLEGRSTQLMASWAAHGGQATMPTNAAILLGFRKGNVQFISHRPVQTGQPLDGSDPTGILVTSGCLLWPPNCGCSHSQRQKKSLFPALCGFPEAAGRLVRAEGFRRF